MSIDEIPKKIVIIGEPHTSLYDFFLMVLFFWQYKLEHVRFPVNKKYFRYGGIPLRAVGAIPVDTKAKNNLVEQMVQQFSEQEKLALHVPPSGTRGKTDRWRSGFYHIAKGANVPVIPAYLCFQTKTYGYGNPIHVETDVTSFMDKIRLFYKDKRGKHPEKESVIVLKEEKKSI